MGDTFTDNDNLISNVTVRPSIDDLVTTLNYSFAYNYPQGNWSKNGSVDDSTQATAFGKEYVSQLDMPWCRDITTADDVADRQLARRKALRMEASFDASLAALTNDLLDTIEVDHYTGPTLATTTIFEITIDFNGLTTSIISKTEP